MILSLVGGFIPGLVWSILYILLNKKYFLNHWKRILLLFLLGGIGSYFCYRLEMHYGSYFKKVKDSNYFEILFYAIFGVAIFEEGYKWFLTVLSNFFNKNNNEKIIFCDVLFVSIGFSTLENILFYAIPYGFVSGIIRIYSAFLSHISCGLLMGYFLLRGSRNNRIRKGLFWCLGLVIPILNHAMYNSFLYGGMYQEYFIYYYIITVIIVLVFSYFFYKERI